MPLHLKKSINQAHLEKNTHEQIVSHLERELKMNGLETPDQLQMNTVTQQATQQNPENPNQLATIGKSQVTIETSAVNSNEKKTQPKLTRIVLTITSIKIVFKQTLTPTIEFLIIPTQTIQIIKKT